MLKDSKLFILNQFNKAMNHSNSELDFSKEDCEILIEECNTTLKKLKYEEWKIFFSLKNLRKQMKQVRGERDYLQSLIVASVWSTPLTMTNSNHSTLERDETAKLEYMGSITKRYRQMIEKKSNQDTNFNDLNSVFEERPEN